MDLKREDQKRNEFNSILLELAKSQTLLKDATERSKVYQKLEKLYHSGQDDKPFKHFYSDIFSALTSIQKDSTNGSIDILAQNLAEIRKGYHPKNVDPAGKNIDISDSIKKLYDHVSLDVARIRYSDAGDWQVSQGQALKVQSKKLFFYNPKTS